MDMLVGGIPRGGDTVVDVLDPFDGSVIDAVPSASPDDVSDALAAAERGAAAMAALTRYERAGFLIRASSLLEERSEDAARLISSEVGKTLGEARGEVARAVQTLALSGEEARRLAGEVVPIDGAPTGGGRFGFTLRVPLGIVVAITPFNFPLNLAAHKVAPALAAGNAVVLKPATVAPLSGLLLGRLLLDAGAPPEAVSVVTGSGSDVGRALVTDARPRMVTFTGSAVVGREIMAVAGLKRAAMELGSNAAVVVTESADLSDAAERCVRGGFALAGQVCISVQRVLVAEKVEEAFVDELLRRTTALRVGRQSDERTDVGPMITEGEAERAELWISEAIERGAKLRAGGGRQGTLVAPTVLSDCPVGARVWEEEAFAPVICTRSFGTLDEAIDLVNASRYGLQAGIFTADLEESLRAAREMHCGGVMINDVPTFRVDLMPYGGEKDSGLGREGPVCAVREMSELRTVCFRRRR